MRLTSLAPLGLIVLTIAAPMLPASAQYIYDDGTDVATVSYTHLTLPTKA